MEKQPRLAARALIVHDGALLLVNAGPVVGDDRWCAPGGGVEAGAHLKDNLAREVYEETGLAVEIGELCAVSEFFDRAINVHQVDLFFRATVATRDLAPDWVDVAGVVARRGFFTWPEVAAMDVFPRFLRDGFWNAGGMPDIIYRGYNEK